MSTWKERAAVKRAQLDASIPSAWRLPPSVLANLPSDVRSIPRSSGILTQLELDITEEDNAAVILENLRARAWSSEQVTVAFCKRAAIAQQLVRWRRAVESRNRLTHLTFRLAVSLSLYLSAPSHELKSSTPTSRRPARLSVLCTAFLSR